MPAKTATNRSTSQQAMRGEESSPPPQNAITLSFNGVDFRLVPTDASSNGSISLSSTNGAYTMNLESFTGSLVVLSSPTEAAALGVTPSSVLSNAESSARTVEDEPPSPDSYSNKGELVLEQGQKQLPFERATSKKRNHSSAEQKSKKLCNSSVSEKDAVPTLGQSSQMTQGTFENDDHPLKSQQPEKKITRASSIEKLVEQEEMKGSQMDMEMMEDDEIEDEPTQIVEDSFNRDEEDVTETCTSNQMSSNAIMEYDDDEDESISGMEASNPYEAKGEADVSALQLAEKHRPCDRWGHTMTLIDENRVLIYGGQSFDDTEKKFNTLNDLRVFDLMKKVWSKPINCEGMPRCWHSATFLPDRQLLISFGGEAYNQNTKKNSITDQVMVLDTEIMLWYPPSVSGAVPTGRSGHTASLLQNDLLVFGGVKNNKWQKSLAVLDTMLWKWSSPKILGDAPRARSYHSSTPVPDSNLLVIFGGNNETEAFNTVHVLDTSTNSWSWSHPEIGGLKPCPRTGHTAVLLEDGKTILIHGGWDPNDDANLSDEDMIFCDSFLLNTETWTWKSGPKPKFAPNQLGAENGGSKRVGAAATLVPGDEITQMLVFGGRVPNDRFANDFQAITVPQRMMGM